MKKNQETAAGHDILHRKITNFFFVHIMVRKMPTPKNI